MLSHRGTSFIPSIASVGGRLGSVGVRKAATLAIQDDYTVDDVPAENTPQGKDSAPSLVDDLGYSQPSTAGTLHDIILGYTVASTGDL